MKPVRTLVTPIAITALAFAGLTAAPARADSSEDIAKFLIGLGAVAIIAKAIDNKSKKDDRDRVVTRSRPNREVTRPNHRKARYALPERCLRTYSAGRKDKQLYSGHCLSRLPYKVARLPESCAYTIKGSRGDRAKAYGPRCMHRNGFYQVESVSRHGDNDQKHSRKKKNGRHIVYN